MLVKKLDENFFKKKEELFNYINNIKKSMKVDIFNIINTTLICNPYSTGFPKNFFLKKYKEENRFFLFIKSSFRFYLKNYYYLLKYFIVFFIYKIFYKKSVEKYDIGIDIFFLTDKIINEKHFIDNHYFLGIYDILKKNNINYSFIVRFYTLFRRTRRIKEVINFFKILNESKENIIFEYSYITFLNFFEIFFLILLYPFKTLFLRQNNDGDIIFNYSLIEDIQNQQFDAFSRYIFGKNIAKKSSIKKIYSWSEFQVIERSFIYGIRKYNKNIELNACQFYINYPSYFNSYVHDVDYMINSSPHKVFVNGNYYLLNRKKVKYISGVSLRYNKVFEFNGILNEKNILLLGSYIMDDTEVMIDYVEGFDNIVFKNHPAVNINNLKNIDNLRISDENIFKLFKMAKIVIGTASGTLVEAVSCGISVIVIASKNNFTANPLNEYGKGKIWDIVYNKDEIKKIYNKLLQYRQNNKKEIEKIALWYKDNFFIKPTEENIKKIFEIN